MTKITRITTQFGEGIKAKHACGSALYLAPRYILNSGKLGWRIKRWITLHETIELGFLSQLSFWCSAEIWFLLLLCYTLRSWDWWKVTCLRTWPGVWMVYGKEVKRRNGFGVVVVGVYCFLFSPGFYHEFLGETALKAETIPLNKTQISFDYSPSSEFCKTILQPNSIRGKVGIKICTWAKWHGKMN